MLRITFVFFAFCIGLWSQPANATFARLKSLAGEWSGKDPDGRPLKVRYEVTAGGAAVIETREPTGEPSMITVFFLDGAELGASHYCSAGVHPRMRSKIGKDAVEFSFVDAVNFKSPGVGHIHAFKLRFVNENEMEQTWTWRERGRDTVGVFPLKRAGQ